MENKIIKNEKNITYNQIVVENKKLHKENIMLKQTLSKLRKFIEEL